MNPEEYIKSGELELLALGIATEQQAAQALAMIAQYPEVSAEYDHIAADLESAFEPVARLAPAKVKENLFATINGSKELADIAPAVDEFVAPIANTTSIGDDANSKMKSSSIAAEAKMVPLFYKYAAAAAVVVALVSLLANLMLFQKYNSANAELIALRSEKDIMANEVQRTSNEVNTLRKKLDISTQLDSKKIMLAGLNAAANAKAAIIYNKKERNVEIRWENLPSIPSDKDLQLWAIVDGKPVDLGVVTMANPSDSMPVTHSLTTLPTKIDAFAFTLEDKGGHPLPQGEMWLIGNF